MSDRLALAVRVMKARHESICPSCGYLIRVGHLIARLTGPSGWCHIDCVPAVRAQSERGPR